MHTSQSVTSRHVVRIKKKTMNKATTIKKHRDLLVAYDIFLSCRNILEVLILSSIDFSRSPNFSGIFFGSSFEREISKSP